MPETKPAKKADTKLLLISWALGIALVVGYTIYWFIMAHQIETNLMAARNDRVSFSSVKVSGYPYRFTFIAKDLTYKINAEETFKAKEISATASTLEPQLWVLEGMLTPQIFLGNNLYNIATQEFKASLRFSSDIADIKRLSISAKLLTLSEKPDTPSLTIGNSQFHLIKGEFEGEFATSVELSDVAGLQIPDFPTHNFSLIILRGIISKSENTHIYTINYGEIIDSFSTKFQNLNGAIYLDKSFKIAKFNLDGTIEGEVESSLPTSKINGKKLVIVVNKGRIDIPGSIMINYNLDAEKNFLNFYFKLPSLQEFNPDGLRE